MFQKPYWDEISADAKDLISRMLDRNQETRITADEVLRHKWIVNNVPGLDTANKSPSQSFDGTKKNKSPTRAAVNLSNKSPRKAPLTTNKSGKTTAT